MLKDSSSCKVKGRQVDIWMLLRGQQDCESLCQAPNRSSRYQQKLGGGIGRLFGWRFFEDSMGIGAAHAERTDPRAARSGACFPFGQRRIDIERAVLEIDFGIGSFVMQAWGDQLMS